MNTTLNNSNRRHQLSISVLNDIATLDGKQGHKLEDWLANIENAAAIVEENEIMVARGKSRGLACDLIKDCWSLEEKDVFCVRCKKNVLLNLSNGK